MVTVLIVIARVAVVRVAKVVAVGLVVTVAMAVALLIGRKAGAMQELRDFGTQVGDGRTLDVPVFAADDRAFELVEAYVNGVEDLLLEALELLVDAAGNGEYVRSEIRRVLGDGVDLFFSLQEIVHRRSHVTGADWSAGRKSAYATHLEVYEIRSGLRRPERLDSRFVEDRPRAFTGRMVRGQVCVPKVPRRSSGRVACIEQDPREAERQIVGHACGRSSGLLASAKQPSDSCGGNDRTALRGWKGSAAAVTAAAYRRCSSPAEQDDDQHDEEDRPQTAETVPEGRAEGSVAAEEAIAAASEQKNDEDDEDQVQGEDLSLLSVQSLIDNALECFHVERVALTKSVKRWFCLTRRDCSWTVHLPRSLRCESV